LRDNILDLHLTSLQLKDRLSLSFKNVRELNKIIDEKLPGRPLFSHEEIVVAGSTFDLYHRDVIECIRVLYEDPDFTQHLAFAPERHYTDEGKTARVYHEMYTGDWWWETQVCAAYTQLEGITHPPWWQSESARAWQTWSNNHSHYFVLRQNTSHSVW